MVKQEIQSFWEVVIPGIILAFAVSILVYVGSALLQVVDATHIPEPFAALESAALGFAPGVIGSLVAQRKKIELCQVKGACSLSTRPKNPGEFI